MKQKTLQTNIMVNDLYDTKPLSCVGLTQSTVIRIIHCSVGLNSLFVYQNIVSFFLTFIFCKVL